MPALRRYVVTREMTVELQATDPMHAAQLADVAFDKGTPQEQAGHLGDIRVSDLHVREAY